MRILVTGDRFWACKVMAYGIVQRLIERYGPELTIVHGDATGVDESFATAAKGLRLAVEPHPADWDRFGKAAGPQRNVAMVATGADICIAVHRSLGTSRGTKDCARRAIAAGIPTYLIDSEKAVPKRLQADDTRLDP